MNVSLGWLASFFPDGVVEAAGASVIADGLTARGLAVDEVHRAFAPLDGVVLGRVLDARPHPDADRLTLCTVDGGTGESEVVCGAPNVEVGASYGYARPGSRLPDGREIRRAEIRGVTSEGMLCSAPELGLEALGGPDGILKLEIVGEPGTPLDRLLPLDDTVLVVDVTSNRGDALSHVGIAREVQSIVGERLTVPLPDLNENGSPASERIDVRIDDPLGCPLYRARVIDGVKVGPSPLWLQLRLTAVGQRPISNVVDVTNYVMLGLGQPLHPFDLGHLAEERLIVRRANPDETLRTLDGVERELDAGMTVIADGRSAIAIGGVMGGEETEVGAETKSVLLESAHFDAASIQRTARTLGLVTEASTRFSRGVDPETTGPAIDAAAAWIAELSGGTMATGQIVAGEAPRARERAPMTLRESRVGSLIGVDVPLDDARSILEGLGFAIGSQTRDELTVLSPSWRFDVHREADLIEEIARTLGYDGIPLAPLPRAPLSPDRSQADRRVHEVRETLRALGYDEAMTPSFVDALAVRPDPSYPMVEMINPISKDDRYLRPMILSTLGRAVVHNLNQQADRVRLFEIGHVFRPGNDGGCVSEDRRVAWAATGDRASLGWSNPEGAGLDFFDIKGDVETLVDALGIVIECRSSTQAFLHPGRQADVVDLEGEVIGFIGQVHPSVCEAWGTSADIFVGELELEPLLEPREPMVVAPVWRTPSVTRDIALTVPDSDSAARVVDAIRECGPANVVSIEVFDRYGGAQLPEGYYSLGVRLRFQADRTLTDEEVDREMEAMITELAAERKYDLR